MLDALGLWGYEGVFRRCSEVTMTVLRHSKETLLSVLEPFIHDPLVEWKKVSSSSSSTSGGGGGGIGGFNTMMGVDITSTAFGAEEENILGVRTVLRVHQRLDGNYNAGPDQLERDRAERAGTISAAPPLTKLEVKGQISRLLVEATSDSNLLRMYIGWAGML